MAENTSISHENQLPADEFVELLTGVQRRLYVYIFSLVADENNANDILQSTNRVLWAKRDTFEAGTAFGAWAGRCALNQVLDFRKRRKNDRHLFDANLLSQVAVEVEQTAAEGNLRLKYLNECVDELPRDQKVRIRQRYEPNVTVADIARLEGRSVPAVSQSLYRIRDRLLACVENKMAQDTAGEASS